MYILIIIYWNQFNQICTQLPASDGCDWNKKKIHLRVKRPGSFEIFHRSIHYVSSAFESAPLDTTRILFLN